jgi:two-component system sensor histidine kinase AlgZ
VAAHFYTFCVLLSDMATPSVWRIVRDVITTAPQKTRISVLFALAIWLVMMVLQAWDSAQRSGPAAVAEFLSALCGSAGGVLLGLSGIINAAAENTSGRTGVKDEMFRRTLIALPAIGLAAGALLAAAVALMVVRALLGTPVPFVIVLSTLFGAMLWLSMVTVMRAARTLYVHAQTEATNASAARMAAGEAELAALQARMNPHFLFNALNTIAALVRTEPRKAERVTENLSDVLRMTLERSGTRMGTVADELGYVRAWLAVEQERWHDRLRIEWAIDPASERASLPPLVIQPLVENALRHGLSSRIDGIRVCISIRREQDDLLIVVSDDGPGFPAMHREGTGLGNLRQRLRALYGGDGSVTVRNPDRGAEVAVRMPFHDTLHARVDR